MRVKLLMASTMDKLDLSECELTSVPPEVFDLSNITDLSLAGNSLTTLPPAIANLTSLRRLVLAGNKLTSLPDGITSLPHLSGLWVHGNALQTLPANLSGLSNLQSLSLAGNRLTSLPDSLTSLTALTEVNVAGNGLEALPPSFAGLRALRKLMLHGNRVAQLPTGLGSLPELQVLHAMGNALTTLPPDLLCPSSPLADLNLSDNALSSLPPHGWEGMRHLRTLLLYGNCLEEVPEGLVAAPALRNLWLEGNPLSGDSKETLCDAVLTSSSLANLGLTSSQLSPPPSNGALPVPPNPSTLSPPLPASAAPSNSCAVALPVLQLSSLCGGPGRGYFKVVSGFRGGVEVGRHGLAFADGSAGQRCLVVAFGSAPGEPNWAGLLARLREACTEPGHKCFDVCYVVDPNRSWYDGGGDEEAEFQYWYARLALITSRYSRVLLLGDSMGASACLLFAPLATAAVAFCPQVDLQQSSIRPARSDRWFKRFKGRLMESVAGSDAQIHIHAGTWQHDLEQARSLPADSVRLHVHRVDSHRLAFLMDAQQELLPVVHEVLSEQMGYCSRPVRLANML